MPLQLRTLLTEAMHPIKPLFPNGKPNPKLKQNFSLLFSSHFAYIFQQTYALSPHSS